ncbi:tetratricopeptide repeat protein [Burkholderia dolosa]|uniref:tetratricopeptide repeat protein n=1 Tax=Burkholderia dolosa TaxID=152500 RepID=UPI001B997C8D|nr:tetratricopeptide repeat protein [Burkholderia dolosa]MBR8311953.1 tetratricopeptide repeat protein [Burkholderia dolosa]
MKSIRILTIGIVAAFIGCCTYAIASGNQSVISGYFEGGTAPGKFEYKDSTDGTRFLIDYYSPSLKRTLTYNVAKFDECSTMAMYHIPKTRQVVVDGSCPSQGGQIYEYVYEWSAAKKNWCLVREITGEKADISSGKITSSEHVSRVKDCPILGAAGPYSYESRAETNKDIAIELKKFRDSVGARETLKRYVDSLPSYSVSELVGYLNSENVQEVNDLAFYLSENGRSLDVIPLLERIVAIFPKRVVAKLNLGDAYWDNNYKEQAAGLYKQYYDEMSSINLKEKIPERVFNRMRK